MNLFFLDFVLSEDEVMFLHVCLNDGDSGFVVDGFAGGGQCCCSTTS